MDIYDRSREDVVILEPHGEMNAEASALLETRIDRAMERRSNLIIIDLAGVETISGVAIEMLLRKKSSLNQFNGDLRLINPSPDVTRILEITRTLDRLPPDTGEDGAYDALQKRKLSKPPRRIGEYLIEKGVLTEEQLNRALSMQRDRRLREDRSQRVGSIIIELGLVERKRFQKMLLDYLKEKKGK